MLGGAPRRSPTQRRLATRLSYGRVTIRRRTLSDSGRLVSGEVVPRQAVAVGPRAVARADVLVSLGVRSPTTPMGVGSHVAADPSGLTAVPGVWVAGNLADLSAQVVGAAAAGSRAAGAINADLVTEDVERALVARRAG